MKPPLALSGVALAVAGALLVSAPPASTAKTAHARPAAAAAAKKPSRTSPARDGASGGPDSLFRSSTFSGLAFRSIGPAINSGRVVDIAVAPNDRYTW